MVVVGLMAATLLIGPPAAFQEAFAQSVVTVQNGYIGLAIGGSGYYWAFDDPGHFLTDEQPMGGRFHIWTTGGDPTTSYDDGQDVNYHDSRGGVSAVPGDKWGAWQVMVDTWSSEQDGVIAHRWAQFDEADRGITSGIWGDDEDGFVSESIYVPTNKNIIKGVWYPTPAETYDPTGTQVQISANGETRGFVPIRCEMEARVMHDTVRFKFTLTNEDSFEHMVGMRVYMDATPSIEDSGTHDLRNIVSIPGYPLITDRTQIFGKDIPDAIEMFNSQEDPVHSIRMIFRGQGATPPDVVGIDDWSVVASPSWTYWYGILGRDTDPFCTWSYEPRPYDWIDDIGYGAFWKPRRLPPGRSMTIIHYIGLASSTSDFTRPTIDEPQFVASVQGPRALKYYTVSGMGQLYPDEFEIRAFVENTEQFIDLQNVSMTLILPKGLTLHPDEYGKYTKAINRISPLSEGSVAWKVIPDGSPTGILEYAVSFNAQPVGGTTVTRQIVIPATEQQPFLKNWQMISVPFDIDNPDPGAALGLLPGYRLLKYDAYQRKYVEATSLVPGEGYWLYLNQAQSTFMTPGEYSPIPWRNTNGYQIPLQKGWNLIGNPYVYAVTLGECKFYYRDYGTMDYSTAISRGLISPTVFWYDPIFRKYDWNRQGERSIQIKPWQGYWLKALRPGVTLIINPVSQIGASLGGEPVTPPSGGGVVPPPTP